nr:uncharacterized protein LOC111505713 [Leptinotarsa decemlineata]
MENQEPRKFKLRRLVPIHTQRHEDTNESIISKNLEPLKQNVEKKKRAQEIYYENHAEELGASPLLRDLGKKPVKQRLGRRVPFPGTNTSAIPPKQRLKRLNNTQNNQINKRKSRSNIAQQRLNLIRARSNQDALLRQNGVKKFRLRRLVPTALTSTPKNFKVQVSNNIVSVEKQRFMTNVKRFKLCLDPEIQLQIKQLQVMYQGDSVKFPIQVQPTTTLLTMNQRFAMLS